MDLYTLCVSCCIILLMYGLSPIQDGKTSSRCTCDRAVTTVYNINWTQITLNTFCEQIFMITAPHTLRQPWMRNRFFNFDVWIHTVLYVLIFGVYDCPLISCLIIIITIYKIYIMVLRIILRLLMDDFVDDIQGWLDLESGRNLWSSCSYM